MDASPATRSRSVWADLDALVLEEVNALRAGPDIPGETPDFASEEEFVDRVTAYLRGHDDPEALIERLCADLALFERVEEVPPAAAGQPVVEAPDPEDSAAPDREEPEPPAEGGAEPGT